MELVAHTTPTAHDAPTNARMLKAGQATIFAAYRRLLLNASVDITRTIAERSALVIAPHPDDETLGCGAAIARKTAAGTPVHIVFVTDGRHSHRSATISPDSLARIRRAEGTQAAAALGVPAENLSFFEIPDGSAGSHTDDIRARLLELISRLNPDDLFIPSPIDRNPDHQALGNMLESMARSGEIKSRVLAYPVWFWTLRTWCDGPQDLATAVMKMTQSIFTLRPVTVRTGGFLKQKRSALAAHKSQTTRLTDEPNWATLDDSFLTHFFRRKEIYFQITPGAKTEAKAAAESRLAVAETTQAPARSAGATRQIRILHMLPDLQMGGGQQLLLRNIGALDGRFAHLVCAVRPGGDMHEAYASAGVRLLRLDFRKPWQIPSALLHLSRAVRHQGIDIIHTNNTGIDRLCGQIAALACRVPVVNTVHSEYEPPAPQRGFAGAMHRTAAWARSTIEQFLGRLTLKQSIAVSDTARRSWQPQAKRWGQPDDRFRVVYPAIDAEPFAAPATDQHTQALRRELGVEGAAPLLLCIGRLVPGKGQGVLLEAMPAILAANPGARLLLIGDGPHRAEFESAASRLSISDAVRFAGTRRDIPQILQLADLVVFPSFREGFGLVLLEAMAAGKPILASRLPVFAEIAPEGEAAAMFTPGDPTDLAHAANALLADEPRRQAMTARGRDIVASRFSTPRLKLALESVYDAALGRR